MRLAAFLERVGIRGKRLQISVVAAACVCLLAAIGFAVQALAGSEGTRLAKGAPPVPKGDALATLKNLDVKEWDWNNSKAIVAVVPTLRAPAIAALRKAGAVIPTPLIAGPNDPMYLLVYRGDSFCNPAACLHTYGQPPNWKPRLYKFLSVVVDVVDGAPKHWILGAYLSNRSPDIGSLGPVTELGHL
jgi:hypothetical protein